MMNAVVKPYHEMCLNSSELIVPRDTYQRALHPARVARIAKEFDERVANEPKIRRPAPSRSLWHSGTGWRSCTPPCPDGLHRRCPLLDSHPRR